MIFLTVALVLTGLMVWGLLTSRKERGIDRRHFATFVGFSAAVIAVTGTTLNAVVATLSEHTSPYTMSPVRQGFAFVISIMVCTSIPVTFFAGLFSRGMQRVALISCTVVVSLMLLLTIAAHFGD
jgi:hypothetical protein